MSMIEIAFCVFAFLTCSSAVGMLWTKNVLHALLCLFLVMFGLAGLYVLAEAEVLAVAHLLIYVGGVMILFLFGVMLSQKRSLGETKRNEIFTKEHPIFWPLLFTLALFLGWLQVIFLANMKTISIDRSEVSQLKEVGLLLLTQYAFPFELLGLFLLIALVASTYIAKKND